MTKQGFIALADLIRHENNRNPQAFPVFGEDAVLVLADFCETQSATFKRGLWLDYVAGKCGPNGGKK